MIKRVLSLSLCFCLLGQISVASAAMQGQAVHIVTAEPIANVEVYARGGGYNGNEVAARTDATGHFTLDITPPYSLRLAHPDYNKFTAVVNRAADSSNTLRCELTNNSGITLTADELQQLYDGHLAG